MNTFLRLAGLGTLIVGLQLVTPDRSSATVINNQHRASSSNETSSVLPIYNNYDPPDNGGPRTSGRQGSGTR